MILSILQYSKFLSKEYFDIYDFFSSLFCRFYQTLTLRSGGPAQNE